MLYCNILANEISFTGQIFDKSTGRGISYAIIQLQNTSKGTTANSEGYFEITLPYGKNILIASSIGYNSDTLCIDSVKHNLSSNIYLNRSSNRHDISEQTKNSSAYEIVNQAILEKVKMSAGLKNYNFNAYTRCDILENNDVGLGTGSINIDPGIVKKSFNLISNIWLTKPMKINGIDEFISKGYYKKSSSYREVVEEQNSYSSLPPSLKALLGTRRIQNLCNDELLFFNRPFPGPVSSYALSYYRYSFEDTLMMDRERIFKLHFEPVDNNDPGLTGDLYITVNSRRISKNCGKS